MPATSQAGFQSSGTGGRMSGAGRNWCILAAALFFAQMTAHADAFCGANGALTYNPFTHALDCTGKASIILTDAGVQYVSTSGNDSNNGTTWTLAKATVAAAIAALPNVAGPTVHFGTVYIGPGTFTETATPIEFNAYLHLACASSSDGAHANGSVIKLGNGRNTALFAYTAAYSAANGYAHYLQVENCTFDGNTANNLTAPALVQIYNGGFQNTFRNVSFQNSTAYALRIDNSAVNFSCYSCTFGGTSGNGGAFYMNDVIGGNVVSFIDTQIDNSGVDPIDIVQTNGDTGGQNLFTFINLKTEATLGSTNHQHVVRVDPRPGGGGHPLNVVVDGMRADNQIASGTYALFQSNQPGYGANWTINDVQTGNYTKVFQDAKASFTSASGVVKHLVYSDTQGADYTPDLELSRGPAILTGTGAPNGVFAANVGAMFLRADGGGATSLYVKETGAGTNTGWIGYGQPPPVAVASLPTCNAAAEGSHAAVNNANATFTAGIGAIVAGGGTNHVPVYCDGTNWRIG